VTRRDLECKSGGASELRPSACSGGLRGSASVDLCDLPVDVLEQFDALCVAQAQDRGPKLLLNDRGVIRVVRAGRELDASDLRVLNRRNRSLQTE
jgi:hypothetical protein